MDANKLTTLRFFRLLLWVHWRSWIGRLRGIRRESPMLPGMLALFVVGYLGVGYWLFHAGLSFLHAFPLVGNLLSQRILYIIFGFFFVMLVFSNLIIGYSTLFKNRETTWLLSLPIPHRNIYRWKFLESLAVSSWALIFLSAPMMIAYGQVYEMPPRYYLLIAAAYLPFVILPALTGSWIIVFLVRILARRAVKRAALVLAAAALLLLAFGIKPVTDADAISQQETLSFDQLLKHTRLSVNPFLPSAWLARSILSWSEGLTRQGTFYFLLLVSNALMGLFVGFEFVGRFYYGSWSIAMSSRAERFQRKPRPNDWGPRRRSPLEFCFGWMRRFSAPIAALTLKDTRLFWRDPAQWIQFMIFFGLLCIYVLILRNVALNFQNPYWEAIISYLNLTASALTLSTLTTRFVFPQFSLEGRRLWILGLAPMGLKNVLLHKFWMSCAVSLSITVGLMIVSSAMLHLPWSQVAFFACAIGIMSVSLSGLAVGLGALFPNYKEDNPSKIVSGFGGTLCLVTSFIYIALTVTLAALPAIQKVAKRNFFIPGDLARVIALALSLTILFIPLILGIRRVKNLEI